MAWSKRNSLLFSFVLVVVWALVAALRLVDPIVLPSPASVVRAIPRMLQERLVADIGLTVGRVLGALAIACALGVPLGLYLGYRKGMYQVIESPLHALRASARARFGIIGVFVEEQGG